MAANVNTNTQNTESTWGIKFRIPTITLHNKASFKPIKYNTQAVDNPRPKLIALTVLMYRESCFCVRLTKQIVFKRFSLVGNYSTKALKNRVQK
ncbi:MAG: hypothetical protein ACI9LE_001728 [Paraglaciecola sp.]|jgi:hypothetical protein